MTTTRYEKQKQSLFKIWRSKIFNRDGFKCRACRGKYKIQLAHITDIMIFIKQYGWAGLVKSFRWDNLVTLCFYCHCNYHRLHRGFNLKGAKYYAARRVYKLFYELKNKRGWAEALPELPGCRNLS